MARRGYREQVRTAWRVESIAKKVWRFYKSCKRLRNHLSEVAIGVFGIYIVLPYLQSMSLWFVNVFTLNMLIIVAYETLVQAFHWIGDEALELFLGGRQEEARAIGSNWSRRVVVLFLFSATAFVKSIEFENTSMYASSPWRKDTALHATFLKCYDGDTCTALIHGDLPAIFNNIPVRVAGIDTPEMRGKCIAEKEAAVQARDATRAFVLGKEVRLVNPQRDKYFRIVADVMTDDGDLAEHLLNKELAIPYDGGTKKNWWCDEISFAKAPYKRK